MLKAIVTGGSGFIGNNLCKFLQEDAWNDWQVIVVDNLSTGLRENQVPGVTYLYESITNHSIINALFKSFKPDVVFHLAAIPRVSFSVHNPVSTFETNVAGTLNLLECLRLNNAYECKFINSSSSSIYGGCENNEAISVNKTPNPRSPYALQKLQSEQLCSMYSLMYGLDTVSLRYFNVTGPGSRFGGAYSTVLSAWAYHLFVDNNYVPFLEGDGSQSRDFCSVENVIKANVLAATHSNKFTGDAFNVAQGESHTLLECKSIIEEIAGKTLNLEVRKSRDGDVKHTLADISKTREILKYNPEINFKKQIEKMCAWYKHSYV